MTHRDEIAPALWARWAERWDRFQANYVPFREQQFEVIGDCIAEWWGETPVRILDLCCGPGSLGFRLLGRLPNATAICIDVDPWLMTMGRAVSAFADRITWVERDLTQPGWSSAVEPGSMHVIVCATATHWFEPDELARIYARLPALLKPRGLFLNADTMPHGATTVRRFAQQMAQHWQSSKLASGGEDWQTFWKRARRESEFADLLAERDRKLGLRRPRVFLTLEAHSDTLVSAGFSDCGEIWRFHDAAVLLAICSKTSGSVCNHRS